MKRKISMPSDNTDDKIHELLGELVYSFQDYLKPLKADTKAEILDLVQQLKALTKPKGGAIREHVDLLEEELSHFFFALDRSSYVIDQCVKIKEDLLEL